MRRLDMAKWHPKTVVFFAVASLLLAGCAPSEISDMAGASNPSADSSIIPKEGSNGKWGYVDRNGKWLIEPQFLGASAFTDSPFDKHDGEAMVQVGDKTCYIDKSGRVVSVIYPNPK
jgi:hypothetical protein